MSDLQKTLMPIFLEEANECLGVIFSYFKSFQTHPQGDLVALDEACRSAHTLKGAGGLVGLSRVQFLAGDLEAGLDHVRSSGRPLTQKDGNALLGLFKELSVLVKQLTVPVKEVTVPAKEIEAAPEPEILPAAAGEEEQEQSPEDICCRFRAGERDYHLPIEQMAEIAQLQPIVPLPLAPAFMKGLMTLRGEVIPVIDLARLHNNCSPPQTKRHLVISRIRGEQLAFLTDGLPRLSPEYGGERLDVQDFVAKHVVRTS